MKLQTKILVILSLVTTTIFLFFASYQFIRFRESKLLYKKTVESENRVINKVLEINRIKYEQLINDNSGWDEMVNFATRPDSVWAKENVDFFVNSFNLNFVLVFNNEKQLVYQFGDSSNLTKSQFIDNKMIELLFEKNSFPHFYKMQNGQLIEFFGATIVPASDADIRKTEPQGYLFVGKKWDDEILNELSQATNYTTGMFFNCDSLQRSARNNRNLFLRILKDEADNQVACLLFQGVDTVEKEKNLLLLMSFMVMVFAVASVMVLMFYFRKTVIQPLKQISLTLEQKKPDLIKTISYNTKEFRQIGEMITGYFEQEKVLKDKYAELEELNAAKSKLFSVVAVNLANPVKGLITLSDLLEDSTKRQDKETTLELLNMIASQNTQTLFLLENLLDWSKIQSGQVHFNPDDLNLKIVVYQVVQELALSYSLKNISLIVDEVADVNVCVDYYMIKTILSNLLSNALKFTYPGGNVKLKSVFEDNCVRITVEDVGIGMDKETIQNLFKLDTGTPKIGTDNERGMGLGLNICKEFIEKHGGELLIESNIGKGSKFMFTIPVIK